MTHNEAYDWAMGELEGRIAVGTILDYGLDIIMMLMTAGAYGPVIAAEKGAFIASKYALRTAKMAIPLVKKGFVPYMEGMTSEEVDPAWLKEQKAIAYALSAEQKKFASYEKSQREKLEKTKAKIVSKPKVVASIIEKYEKQHNILPAEVISEQIEPQIVVEDVPSIVVKKKQKKREDIVFKNVSVSTSGRGYKRWRSAQRRKKRKALKEKNIARAVEWYNS